MFFFLSDISLHFTSGAFRFQGFMIVTGKIEFRFRFRIGLLLEALVLSVSDGFRKLILVVLSSGFRFGSDSELESLLGDRLGDLIGTVNSCETTPDDFMILGLTSSSESESEPLLREALISCFNLGSLTFTTSTSASLSPLDPELLLALQRVGLLGISRPAARRCAFDSNSFTRRSATPGETSVATLHNKRHYILAITVMPWNNLNVFT